MTNILNIAAVVLWIVTGLLWLRAATVPVPTNIQSGYGTLVGVQEMSAGFEKQAFWNTWAAVASCVAAVVQAASLAYALKQ